MRILQGRVVSKNNLSSYFPIEWMIKQNHIHPSFCLSVCHSVCLPACLSVSQSASPPHPSVPLTLCLVAGANRLLELHLLRLITPTLLQTGHLLFPPNGSSLRLVLWCHRPTRLCLAAQRCGLGRTTARSGELNMTMAKTEHGCCDGACTHTRAHACTHTHTYAHAHTHTLARMHT